MENHAASVTAFMEALSWIYLQEVMQTVSEAEAVVGDVLDNSEMHVSARKFNSCMRMESPSLLESCG